MKKLRTLRHRLGLQACICLSFFTAMAGVSFAQDTAPVTSNTSPDARAAATHNFLQQMNDGFTAIYEKAAPSVVIIDTVKKETPEDSDEMGGFEFFFRDPQGQQGQQGGGARPELPPEARRSEGSGFFIRNDGYILTNNHVIEDAESITVKLKDGRHFKGTVVGADEMADIAVVKINLTNTPILEFADSDSVKVGEMICSIGTPFNFNYSFAFGWVSGKSRSVLPSGTYEDYLQTDSFVNPGDSGGPVLDINGKVVGMNTLINGLGRKMTFAIPSNMLKNASDQLIATGKITRSWLGIGIATVDDDLPRGLQVKGIDHGVVVSSIQADAPAAGSDLRVTDVITQVDGKDIVTAHDLQREVMGKKVGEKVNLTVFRDGKTVNVAVVTGALPDMTAVSNNAVKPQKKEAASSGESQDAGNYGFKVGDSNSDATKGVVVTDVTAKGPAAAAGLQKDDIITEVDSQPVDSTDSFKDLVDKHNADGAAKDKGLLLFINRKGEKTYAIVKPN